MEIVYATKKVNSINTISCHIEQTFNDNYSIIVFDEEGGVWIEKYAQTLKDAEIIAEKLFKEVINNY